MKNLRLGPKLLLSGLFFVALPIIIVGIISVYQSSENMFRLEKGHIAEVSATLAGLVETGLTEQLVDVRNLSYSNSIIAAAEKVAREGERKSQREIALAEKELIKIKAAEGDRLSSINLAGKNGIFYASSDSKTMKGTDVSGREYLEKALKGIPNVGSVVVSRATGRVVCSAACPVYSSTGKDITGAVVMSMELRYLTDLIDEVKKGQTGSSFIVNRDGLYVSHPVKENILKVNISNSKGMEAVWELVKQGKSGITESTLDGIRRVAAVSPVKLSGWTVVTSITVEELYAPGRFTRNIIVSVGLIFLILASVFFYFFARSLTRPMNNVVAAAQRIASGDLSVSIPVTGRQDEIGDLAGAFAVMVESLKEKAKVAERIAANDLTVKVTPLSGKDMLGSALATMVETLRNQIQELVEGVNILASSGSEIMASVTQLTSGSAETSTAVSETTTTMEELKQRAEVSSQKAKDVVELGQKAVEVSRTGLTSVEAAIAGMNRIKEQVESIADMVVRLSEQSQAIGEITSTVNDLAEQSNLLAVNASIEAAKAGEQGKGFAVVAQEIKSLAEQSKQATAQIRMILFDVQKAISSAVMATEQGSKAVEAGVRLSAEVGESIDALAQSVAEATNAAIQISVSSQQQLIGMDQVVSAMENIRDAASQTAASTRQTEAATHTLHNLGLKLQEMVRQYKI